ncbi:unnamed protein product [Sphenostylis stenocarpa]|uniref:Uncharacterized protein n=1 Tax=Sphenostylis stenocarpa TaxID=92480 RepID=A0AA86SZ54_9FABA|nr:unnamed protein product [Sphenostylis stenocarpa]
MRGVAVVWAGHYPTGKRREHPGTTRVLTRFYGPQHSTAEDLGVRAKGEWIRLRALTQPVGSTQLSPHCHCFHTAPYL